MADNTTTFLFKKPTVGGDENAWGGYLNENWDKADDCLDGTIEITPKVDIDGASGDLKINGTAVTATAAEMNVLDGITATTAELNILDGVTSTAAELNILDGVTATKDEINLLDGVTASTAELNILDGVTATTAELNIMDGVTATATEINKLDGVTATTAELNILDGVTATATEINTLDGITASTTELNYCDGVTSSIQTQINNAAELVNDTTPQLGGNLASNGNDILIADSDKVIFGAGSDLQIYHDGNASYINETGTGSLRIQTSDLIVEAPDGSDQLYCNAYAQTTIHYNGSAKLSTTSTGVNVTGRIDIDGYNAFAISKSANGYQKIASGAIIQWGTVNIGPNTYTSVTLPLAFPNSFRSVTASHGSGGAYRSFGIYPTGPTYVVPLTNSTFEIGNADDYTITYNWMAVGY